jgi:hypothetical protein
MDFLRRMRWNMYCLLYKEVKHILLGKIKKKNVTFLGFKQYRTKTMLR